MIAAELNEPAPSTTDAVVLRLVPYREADVIVTLFGRDRGKFSALARAARKSRRRFGGALGLLTLSRVDLAERRRGALWTLRSAEPIETFSHLAADMASFAHANYATELVRELTAEEQPDPPLFDLLIELYRELGQGASVSMLRAFELQLLEHLGLTPVLDHCTGCGSEDAERLDDPAAVLDPAKGGVLCGLCSGRHRGPGARRLPGAARRFLLAVQTAPTLAAARRMVEAPPTAAAARDALLSLLLAHTGKALRSLEFISKLSNAKTPDP